MRPVVLPFEQNSTPWSLPVKHIEERLGVSAATGLSSGDAQERLSRFGRNQIAVAKRISSWSRFFGQFKSPVVMVLLVATGVSAAVGEIVDAIAIVSIVLLNALIGYFQEAKAEAAVEALRKLAAPKSRVLRDGQIIEVPSAEVCLGDVLVFEAGDYVSADARLVLAEQLSAEEAVLTGESLPVTKVTAPVEAKAAIGDRANMIFAGTAISTGSGRAIAVFTGMGSEIGRIAGMLEGAKQEETPLQKTLEQVSSKLLWFCLVVVALVSLFGFLHGETWLAILMTAISLGVAAIPEGLPAVVTLALALAIRRMTKRNVIIRHLPAVETLGSTDVICTDKTGTLTTGKMTVREVILADSTVVTSDALGDAPGLEELIRSSVLCSNASLSDDGKSSTGDPTEVALLQLALQARQIAHAKKSGSRIAEWSFDSVRKRMSVATIAGKELEFHVKGAPESILPLCQLPVEVEPSLKAWMLARSREGRRLLAIAKKRGLDSEKDVSRLSVGQVESGLTFLGLVAISDPPRQESLEAIRACKQAGVKVVMITGDHPDTASAIAKELGILEPGVFDGVISGPELASLSREELESKVTQTAVYARVSPEDKLRIVEAWKKHGKVVAMTGDGVNDAPALKASSIGVSMGKGGTEVARQASSMILADDNFATIVSAVEEGRAIYGNIRRTIQYLLSGNLAEILVMLGAAIAGWPAPLAPIHLLWINLVTDGLPSLALAAEPVPKDVLRQHSRPSPKNFFDRSFYGEMAFVGGITTALALAIYGYSLRMEDEITARTHVFSFLVFSEIFRSFACRHQDKTYFQLGPVSNLYHLAVGAFPIGFQLFLHHSPWFQAVFKVKSISWGECFILILITLIPVTAVEIRKLIRAKVRDQISEGVPT